MYEVELKPCPFCGGKVKNMSVSYGVAGIITCDICKTKFVIPWNESETANDLHNAWNRRQEERSWPKENPHVIAHPVGHQPTKATDTAPPNCSTSVQKPK